ncbi:MAG: hypothetical protein SPF64_08825 [Faecalibacterium longum]|nr:hypothetical protein [Faecalibacterium prausnitzii]MDY5550425.1 hypothetical protein [Faecalibacterium longum]
MRLKSALRRGVAAAVIAGIVVSSGIPAYAKTWDIADGDITVKAGDTEGTNRVTQGETTKEDTDTVITGKSDKNTVTIDTSGGNVDVTFDNLKIDVSDAGKAAVTVQGGHDVTIELDGDNELKSGSYSGHEEDPHTGAAGIGDGASRKGEIVPDASSRAGGMIPPSRPRQALAGHRQAETAIRPENPAALGAGTRDAETDLRTITKNHR